MASMIPLELNWTKLRAKCSASAMFKNLQLGIENDIATFNSIPMRYPHEGFASGLTSDGSTFIVARRERIGPRVVFFIKGEKIEIRDEVTTKNYVASVTLNDEGRCKLKIEDREMELWQVRRLALESLFFGD
ncbi:MAG: hypothetical protein WBE76_00610 [Terracidiphilus sp.]